MSSNKIVRSKWQKETHGDFGDLACAYGLRNLFEIPESVTIRFWASHERLAKSCAVELDELSRKVGPLVDGSRIVTYFMLDDWLNRASRKLGRKLFYVGVEYKP